MKKALLIAAAITTAVITPLNSAVEARTRLSGAGASFPAKIYTRWFKDLSELKVAQELTIRQLDLVVEEKHSSTRQ